MYIHIIYCLELKLTGTFLQQPTILIERFEEKKKINTYALLINTYALLYMRERQK